MEIIPVENKRKKKKPRVAAYARVSTLTESRSSYESQVNYFTTLIQNNPELGVCRGLCRPRRSDFEPKGRTSCG